MSTRWKQKFDVFFANFFYSNPIDFVFKITYNVGNENKRRRNLELTYGS